MKVVLTISAVVLLILHKISAEKRHFTCGKKIHLFILFHLQLYRLFVTVNFSRPKNCKAQAPDKNCNIPPIKKAECFVKLIFAAAFVAICRFAFS